MSAAAAGMSAAAAGMSAAQLLVCRYCCSSDETGWDWERREDGMRW